MTRIIETCYVLHCANHTDGDGVGSASGAGTGGGGGDVVLIHHWVIFSTEGAHGVHYTCHIDHN